ncbi:MAG: glycosyltransferase, partial [Gemmatimonadaceae bacterium]
MTTVALVLVSLPIVIALYAYAGYPFALKLFSQVSRAPDIGPATELPRVSVVIPAYNEETQIASAVEAVINQDYPADRMQILVVSD